LSREATKGETETEKGQDGELEVGWALGRRSRRTCLLDEVLVDPAIEVVPAIPPNPHFVTRETRVSNWLITAQISVLHVM